MSAVLDHYEQYGSLKTYDPNYLKAMGKEELESYKQYKFGSREGLFKSGKPVKELEMLLKPKRIYSPITQIVNLFGFNLSRNDARKIFIAIAKRTKVTQSQWVPEAIYKEMIKCKTPQEYYEKSFGKIEFDKYINNVFGFKNEEDEEQGVFNGVPYIKGLDMVNVPARMVNHRLSFDFETIFDERVREYILNKVEKDVLGVNSPYLYEYFIEKGDSISKSIAKRYGIISYAKEYLLTWEQTFLPHEFFTFDEIVKNKKNPKYGRKGGKKISDFKDVPDVYVGAATHISHKRINATTAEIHLLYCDIDYYNIDNLKHLSHWEIYWMACERLTKAGIPLPTDMDVSNGITLKWKHSPIGHWKKRHWQELQEKIYYALKDLGADNKVTKDSVRLGRLCGSLHGKTGNKIYSFIFSEERYYFEDLLQYTLPDYYSDLQEKRKFAIEKSKQQVKELTKQVEKPKKQAKEDKSYLTHEDNKKLRLFFDASIPNTYFKFNYKHYRIMVGLLQLALLRKDTNKMIGHREFIIFLTRYYYLCMTGSKEFAKKRAKEMYFLVSAFEKYTWEDMIEMTASAEDAWERWKEDWRKGYNYKFETIIKELNITLDEQRKIDYLRTDKVQQEIHKEYMKKYNEANNEKINTQKREKYQKELENNKKLSRAEQKELRLSIIKKFLEENPSASQREIEKGTGISQSAIQRLIKEI